MIEWPRPSASGAIALAIVGFRLHLHVPPTRHRIDYLGAACLTGGVGSLILVTAWGGTEYAWDSPTIVALTATGLILLAAFLWQERRAIEPIIPLELFHSRVFDVAVAMGFTVGMAMFGAIIFIPLYLQVVYGASATSQLNNRERDSSRWAGWPDCHGRPPSTKAR